MNVADVNCNSETGERNREQFAALTLCWMLCGERSGYWPLTRICRQLSREI